MGNKDFFLDPDDAMTMGDINYMRTSKRTRRTFPKTLSNKNGFAVENEVSSVENRNNFYQNSNTNQNTTVNTVFNPTPSGSSDGAQTNSAASQDNFDAPKPTPEKRRPTGDSMDMFRNMAKNIKR